VTLLAKQGAQSESEAKEKNKEMKATWSVTHVWHQQQEEEEQAVHHFSDVACD
jgi:hypothetical protein